MIRSSLIEAWDTRCAKIALHSVSKRTRILLGIVAVYIGAVAFLLTLGICGYAMFRTWRDQRDLSY